MEYDYSFEGMDAVISPALIYYRSLICENIQKAVRTAKGADRLWPHIKSHKMADMIRLSMEYGITRFKCATIAEAEVAASCGAGHVVISYPLVGPNIARAVKLVQAFPGTQFYAIGDNLEMLAQLGDAARESTGSIQVLVDVNLGMDRTGVSMEEVPAFCEACAGIPGIALRGLHCYDGHRTEQDYTSRKMQVDKLNLRLIDLFRSLKERFAFCSILILGGTPSFPCHADVRDAFFSPGTLFVYDDGYRKKFPDLPYVPGAAILTRVVSCPGEGIFTLDLGYKGSAADPAGIRGRLLGVEHCEEWFQSEEHWTFRMKPGYERERPKVGEEFFVIPTHICPTSALYPSVPVVEGGKIVDHWSVSARNRQITY